jgi:hypothetical protein
MVEAARGAGEPGRGVHGRAETARYLVVAHQTVTSPELLEQVRVLREQQKDAEFALLVPATPVRHLLFRRGDDHDVEATARKRGTGASDVREEGAPPARRQGQFS